MARLPRRLGHAEEAPLDEHLEELRRRLFVMPRSARRRGDRRLRLPRPRPQLAEPAAACGTREARDLRGRRAVHRHDHGQPLRGLRARAAGDPLAALALLRARVRPECGAEECSRSRHSLSCSPRPGCRSATGSCCPRAIHFLTNYDTDALQPPDPRVVVLQLRRRRCSSGSCSSSQMPLVVLGLVTLGVLSSRTLRRHRRLGYFDHRGDRARAAGPGSRDDLPRAAADVDPVRGIDLARRLRRAAQGKGRPGLGYSGRLMARAAVKAKQQAAQGAGAAVEVASARTAEAQRRRQPEPGALLRPHAAPPEVGLRRARRHLRAQLRRSRRRLRQRRRPATSSSTASSAAAAAAPSRRRRTRSRRIPRRDTAISPPRTSRRATPGQAMGALHELPRAEEDGRASRGASSAASHGRQGEQGRDRSTSRRSRRRRPPIRARRSCPAARSGRRSGTNPTVLRRGPAGCEPGRPRSTRRRSAAYGRRRHRLPDGVEAPPAQRGAALQELASAAQNSGNSKVASGAAPRT